jgi:hypothetical protein
MEAFRGLNTLMQGIYWLGDRVYPESSHRLFAHQFGDGFLITSTYREESLDRAILICIALMRHGLDNGAIFKSAVSEGKISDIKSCYPPEIRNASDKSHIIFGSGVMTVFPVLGEGLINSVAVDKKSPSGPILAVEDKNRDRISAVFRKFDCPKKLITVNWLLGEYDELTSIQTKAGFRNPDEAARIEQMEAYLEANDGIKDEWVKSARGIIDGCI